MVTVRDFKDLTVWQKAKELAVLIYRLTKDFPKAERFGLVSQIQRAAVSIPSNIAEGFARQYTGEFLQFLYIALASAAELETQLIIATEVGYLSSEQAESSSLLLKEVQRMLNGLINSLKNKKEKVS